MNINDLNNGPVISYMRPALIIGAETIGFEWIDIDGTGAVPEIWNGRERCTEAGAVIAVYREPNDNLGAARYQLMRELVAIAEGAPEVDGMRAEQMRELRRALEDATERAETARESFVHQQRATESAIVQARRWKRQAIAAQHEADEQRASTPPAIVRAVSRANHAHELLEKERSRAADLEGTVHELTHRTAAANERTHLANMRADLIQAEARRWKTRALAAETEAEALHATVTSAETRARIATTDRDVLEAKLDGTIASKNAAMMERNEARDELEQARKNALDVITRVAACLPMPDAITDTAVTEPGFQIDSYFGAEDNIPVVQIDTIGMNGRCRVNLNDGVIWDGDPNEDERPGSNAEPLPHEGMQVVAHTIIEPSPIACEHDPRDAERLEMRRNLCDDHFATIGDHQKTINRQLDTIREQADTIDRLRGERASEEQRANSAEEQVRLNSNALESVQAELNEARAAQQVSANAGHEYGKRIWAIVREAAGVEGDPIPTIKELREQRDAAIHLAEARQDARDTDKQVHERQVANLTAERDAARQAVAACQNRLAAAEQRSTAWQRVLDHPAMNDALDDDNMTANQAVGYRLTELANTEQKWNAHLEASAPKPMHPTPQEF